MIEMLFQDDSDYLFHQFHLHLVQNIQVDIVNDINNDIQLFADDTSLFVVVENDHAAAATSLTDDLNVISNWAKKWGKRKGTNTEPWGTPALILLRVEEKPSETTFCCRSER
jgi:hypothetical protein